MAEQKTEDTTPVAARRVARPVVGPAGTVRSGVRPVLRPVGVRPAHAPFAPTGPDRQALGGASGSPRVWAATVPEVPPAGASEVAAESPVLAGADAEGIDDTAATCGPVLQETECAPLCGDAFPDAPALEADVSTAELGADANAATLGEPGIPQDGSAVVESAAADAWPHWLEDVSEPALPDAASASADVAPSGSPTAVPAWLEDDYTPADTAVASEVSASDSVARVESGHHGDEEAAIVSYAAEIADATVEWTAHPDASDAAPPLPDRGTALGGDPVAAAEDIDASAAQSGHERWPDPLLAEYAPYVAGPTDTSDGAGATLALVPADPAGDMPPGPETVIAAGAEPVGSNAPTPTNEAADADLGADSSVRLGLETAAVPATARGEHVSAALDRLAARVRAGEIDVALVTAEATDAAILASLLAAMLGGSSSR